MAEVRPPAHLRRPSLISKESPSKYVQDFHGGTSDDTVDSNEAFANQFLTVNMTCLARLGPAYSLDTTGSHQQSLSSPSTSVSTANVDANGLVDGNGYIKAHLRPRAGDIKGERHLSDTVPEWAKTVVEYLSVEDPDEGVDKKVEEENEVQTDKKDGVEPHPGAWSCFNQDIFEK